jgi:heme exporter protein D
MIWQSWNDFFKMGGYALYVWGSVIVVFVFMAAEVISLRVRSNALRAQLSNVRGSARNSVSTTIGTSASKEGEQ